MRYLFLRWVILAIAIALTAWLFPIVMLLTCPLVILTLGLFMLVINALMLSLTDWLLPNILTVDGFWTTFFAALVISIISGLLGIFVHDESHW